MEKIFKFLKIEQFSLFIILLINSLFKIPINGQGFFAFTYDQGRDLLKVAQIIFDHHLTLIGATTGLQGVFYGPWWYYFLSPILFLSDGNPQGVANFFGFLSILTIVFLYILLKKITNSPLLAFSLAFVASTSGSWMFAPTIIWNTSLTPILLIAFFYFIDKIINTRQSTSLYFFLLGAITFLIMDSELPFGLMLSLYLLIAVFLFRKIFYKKQLLLSILGLAIILLPRIVFDIRHNFLISRSIISYLIEPKIYGDQIPMVQRFWYRVDLYWGVFSQAFTENNKFVGLLFLIILGVITVFILKDRKIRTKMRNDILLKFSLLLCIFSLLFFTLYKDVVWNYYLIGIPTLLIIIIAKIFSYAFKVEKLKLGMSILIGLLVVLNFTKGLSSPFKITWQGDGATYRNQKMIMDYILGQKPHDYSYYAYTPAIFDYPFEYLFYWYAKKGLIEVPKERQKTMFLIIRDASNKKYLSTGWYGDKTRDNTTIVEKKIFPGDIALEKHIVNEKK